MARHVLQISNATMRAKLKAWCDRVPDGWRVEFKEPKRSDIQNDRMWAMLADISKQGEINGKKYDSDQWKCIFMKQMGKEVSFLPTIDGEEFFPTGFRSSDLSVREMCDMQTFMEVWGSEAGIAFSASAGKSDN